MVCLFLLPNIVLSYISIAYIYLSFCYFVAKKWKEMW